MKLRLASTFILVTAAAFAGAPGKKAVAPVEEETWKFSLSAPGWMQGVQGTVGIDGLDSKLDLGFKNIVNKIDMATSLRGEVGKGRFGVMGDFFYASASDSLGVGGALQKVDVRLDETLADLSLRWRVVEGPRGFVDLLAGVRYTNIYQAMRLQSDDDGVGQASADLVDHVSFAIRDRLNNVLSEGRFRNALSAAVSNDVTSEVTHALGPDPRRRAVAIGAIGGFHPLRTALLVEDVITQEEAQLRAEVEALNLKGAARAAEVQRRVTAAKGRIEKRVFDVLEKNLNRSFARCDDWWDPYVGLRARLNFTPSFYLVARGDIGGFGVGSDLMWQAEGAFGVQLTRSIYAEAGYRALSFDYEGNGFTFDAIMHGAQVTVGMQF